MARDNRPQPDTDQSELSLTGLIKALDNEAPATPETTASAYDLCPDDLFDPNATVNYQQVGLSYPELPFAHEEGELMGQQGTAGSLDFLDSLSSSGPSGTPGTFASGTSLSSLGASGSLGALGSAGGAGIHTPTGGVPERARARSSRPARSAGARAAGGRRASGAARAGSAPGGTSRSPLDYRPLTARNSSYKIRGSGKSYAFMHNKPIVAVAALLFLALGVGVFYYASTTVMSSLETSFEAEGIDLTQEQTRAALDSRLPVLLNYVDLSIEDSVATLQGTGQFTYANDRYSPDSPDASAAGSEMVSMPQEMTEEQMVGYYEGSYNAYSLEELAEYFNGAYVMDLARGDLGSWNKLKFVNFNTTSIADEMARVAEQQQLTGETVTISAEGTDSRGNTIIQGQKVLDGERVLYFRIAACPFDGIYNAASLQETSVYITCTLATYDFFTGAEEITPAQ